MVCLDQVLRRKRLIVPDVSLLLPTMEIYVLKEGRRIGPFLPFKLRELLEDRTVQPSDPAWIEGMESWSPLSSIEALESWMPPDPSLPPPLPIPAEFKEGAASGDVPGIQARRIHAWLRWLARIVDKMLWFSLLWVIAVCAGWLQLWDYLLLSPLLLIGAAVLWIPVESFLLSRFTTTPGKWLLGIRVTDDLGQPLTYLAAVKRTVLVVCTGAGLGLPALSLLPVLQGTMSWLLYRRTGITLWDRAASSRVVHSPLPPMGLITVAALGGAWFALCTWIFMSIPLPPDAPAEFRQKLEELHQLFDRSQQNNATEAEFRKQSGS